MISIQKVNIHNVWELLALEVDENQKSFVATNIESIVEAYTTLAADGVALPFGIYKDKTPVGFLMIGYGDQPEVENPAIANDSYCIWRLMIDRNHQGKGYGTQALRLALDDIRTLPCGPARTCFLSYEPENTTAKKLYYRFGFRETGEMDENEVVAALNL